MIICLRLHGQGAHQKAVAFSLLAALHPIALQSGCHQAELDGMQRRRQGNAELTGGL